MTSEGASTRTGAELKILSDAAEAPILKNMQPHGILFDRLHGGSHPATPGSISAEHLAYRIERVGISRILPARQWMQCALTATLRPTDVCLTFDEGLLCQYEVALPVLRFYGLTAFWFADGALSPHSADRTQSMDALELRRLHEAGHVVGLRAPAVLRGSAARQRDAYQARMNCLDSMVGEAPLTISHASALGDRGTLAMLREMGIVLGFRSDMSQPGRSELEYPREHHANLVAAMAA